MFKIQNRGQFGNPIDFFIKPWQDESIEITDLLHLFSPDFSNDNNYLKTQLDLKIQDLLRFGPE